MDSSLLNIINLDCSYNQKDIVLKIPSLGISRGSLNFIIGISGIGKSTFIETLGLMNDTALKNEGKVIFDNEVNILNLWANKDGKDLSAFRKENYSFIFQSTNLMPNFSAGENMCLALLLNGKTFEESKNIVINLMKEVDLDPTLFDRKVTELSGGQRQRIAFVRAFAAKFEVLFGDEPTGNLDEETAHKLMSTLKTYLQKNRKTGIIVSHDIDLALDFADHIFFIKKKGNDQYHYGHLDQNQVFTKKEDSWFFGQRNITSSIRQSIQQIFKSGDIDE